MRQLKFHCHQHVNDIGYLSLFQAASTPKASPRQMKWVAMVIQEQLPKDFLLYSRSSKLADSVFLNPHLFLYLWADAFKCLLNPVLCWTSSSRALMEHDPTPLHNLRSNYRADYNTLTAFPSSSFRTNQSPLHYFAKKLSLMEQLFVKRCYINYKKN